MPASTFEQILKFNPYHGKDGRFASADSAASFTYRPGASAAHDRAIAREKERGAAGAASAPKKEPKYTEEEQVQAIKDFTISDYGYIRKIQSGNKMEWMDDDERAEYAKKGEAIEEYIASNGPYNGAIYRGINTKGDESYKVGQTIDMRGTSSWTTEKDMGYEWAGKNANGDKGPFNHKTGNERAYVFEMKKAPSKSAYIDDISANKGEKEVLVSTTTKFKITNIASTTERTVVTVEEVT